MGLSRGLRTSLERLGIGDCELVYGVERSKVNDGEREVVRGI